MTANVKSSRRGMTLVELLVVVLILGLLSVVVLPSIAGSADRRRNRDAARSVSSFIARAQSRAINAPAARGLILQPFEGNPDGAADLVFADAPEPYCGALPLSRAHVVQPPDASLQTAVNFIVPGQTPPADQATLDRLGNPAFAVTGDVIQFGGIGPLFTLVLPPDALQPSIRLNPFDGQNFRTLAWPRTTAARGVEYAIYRQPRRASSGVLQLQRGSAVDIGWSCLGVQTLGRNGIIKTAVRPSAPVAIMFDTAGKPLELVHSGGQRTRIAEPLYLLIGSAQMSGDDYSSQRFANKGADADNREGANWQFADSVWVCIDNATGLVRTGPVDHQASNVLDSQRFVRLTIGLGVTEQ